MLRRERSKFSDEMDKFKIQYFKNIYIYTYIVVFFYINKSSTSTIYSATFNKLTIMSHVLIVVEKKS